MTCVISSITKTIYVGTLFCGAVLPTADVANVILTDFGLFRWSLCCQKYEQIPVCGKFYFLDLCGSLWHVVGCKRSPVHDAEGTFFDPIGDAYLTFEPGKRLSITKRLKEEKAALCVQTGIDRPAPGVNTQLVFAGEVGAPDPTSTTFANPVQTQIGGSTIRGNGYGSAGDTITTTNPLILYESAKVICGICPSVRRENDCQTRPVVPCPSGQWTSIPAAATVPTGEFKILKSGRYSITVCSTFNPTFTLTNTTTSTSSMSITSSAFSLRPAQTIVRRKGNYPADPLVSYPQPGIELLSRTMSETVNIASLGVTITSSGITVTLTDSDDAGFFNISNVVFVELEAGDFISVVLQFITNGTTVTLSGSASSGSTTTRTQLLTIPVESNLVIEEQ
jgi:hypothetical protein